MKKVLLSIAAVCFSFAVVKAEKVFEFNSTCQQAYQELTKLKINSGIALAEKARQQNPDNLIPLLLESYADFYVLFFNEDPAEYAVRYPKFLQRIEAVQEGPKTSPFYNFCVASMRVHKAATAIKFGHTWEAGWDFRRAFQAIKENKKQYPTFAPNDLLYGALQAVIGTIPKGYKFIASLFGMSGSLTEGMKTVRGFVYSNDPWAKMMANEANFMYPYLLFYMENKKEEALQFVQQRRLDLVNNHLHAYMAANLALNNKQADYTRSIIQNRNTSDEYLKVGVWDFEMGFAKLYHLDTQEGARYMESFLAQFKGKFYVKDAYQKLSWCYYLQGNMKAAEAARKNVLAKGATDSDADKQALKDAKTGVWPDITLLKARLLNDGGYHHEALGLLHGKSEHDFPKEEERLEFTYRVARIYDDLGRDDDAIQAYLVAIRIGENRKEYFAARAALQVGQIYESKGQKATAISYYRKCLDMGDHEYKNSLDQRAKSGIARCEGK
ncbi:tetratricopeptide repeat protein [Sediminibacterium ginsengisoli]|uniref:Tetratricopeptide repeat-containing protein n=1 Tax=Sediminibacterium ginsengisoli TaxID=413434 RepID=A0A1T4N025_9BACT|nr:bacterial transcriptional activator domain-containing protein [Sediminibacterium ginsengisoli]SJZ72491.1 Tetratricopeptide repeat-containing protein [Sediminibacterium ginsengisoli]